MKSNECQTTCPECGQMAARYREIDIDTDGNSMVIDTIECGWCGFYEEI